MPDFNEVIRVYQPELDFLQGELLYKGIQIALMKKAGEIVPNNLLEEEEWLMEQGEDIVRMAKTHSVYFKEA